MTGLLELFGDAGAAAFIADHVKVKSVRKGSSNIAGITIPTFESVEFENIPWDIFDTDWYVDDAIQALRDAVSLKEAYKVLEVQHRLLSAELRTTSQPHPDHARRPRHQRGGALQDRETQIRRSRLVLSRIKSIFHAV
mgnify:CR=1 FL=1